MVTEQNKQFKFFAKQVDDILNSPQIQKLGECSHHYRSTRLQHCLNVAYYSFLICRKMGWDYTSAARGGLLHDLFYYEYQRTGVGCLRHSVLHPKIALRRAERLCSLNPIEQDIILHHMFIPNPVPPAHKEAYVVCAVDKCCAAYEALYGVVQAMKLKLALL